MPFSKVVSGVAFVMLVTASAVFAADANWPQWRGPHNNGTADGANYPVKWDQSSNVLWKAELPGKGCSTPIVWNKQVFVTAPTDGEDSVLAFDWSGKLLWQTKLGSDKSGKHRNSSNSNPSPTTDGKTIFVYFKSGVLAALDFEGKIRWQINMVQRFGPDEIFFDQGTSPALSEKSVIIARIHHGDSWLAAFDKETGEMQWKTARNYKTPVEADQSYATPIVIRRGGKEVVLTWGAEHLTAHSMTDGKMIWECGNFNPEAKLNWPAVSTPVVVGDLAIVSYGRNDRNQPLLSAIKLDGVGDVTGTNLVWRRTDVSSFVPSPSEYKGRIYLLRDRGEVECLDPVTGKTLWTGVLPRTTANFYSSPVIGDGKLYAIREDGVAFVVGVENGFELLSENTVGEHVIASPVLVANRLFIRSEQNLFCIGAQ